MALPATIRRFEIELADADRGIYERLDVRVAQHPSESERYLVTRVLARALEHAEGLEFGKGISTDDEPALWQRDLRGDCLAWIEVGSPSAERLHKASKACRRVALYTWRAAALRAEYDKAAIHRAEAIELVALEADILDQLAASVARQNQWSITVNDATVYLETANGASSLTFGLARQPLRQAS